MSNRQEEIRQKIMARVAARRKAVKPKPPKPARTLDQHKRRQAQQVRQKIKTRQDEVRKKIKTRVATAPVSSLGEDVKERLQGIQSDFDDLQDDIMLTSVHDDMGRVEAVLTNLAADLEELRTTGYAFRSYLENKINVLTDKWEDISDQIDVEIEEQSDKLEGEAEEAEGLLRRALGGNQAMVRRAESAVQSLKRKTDSARRALQNRYDDVARTIHQTRQQLDEVQWAFEQADQTTFEFLEAEFLIAACQAKLLEDPDEDEGAEGVLYLTDERLIFEQKEKVATKKFLFVTTESETVQEVDFETLLDWIEKVEVQDKKKFLSTKEMLELSLSPEADRHSITFRLLKGAKNEAWTQSISRARSGEIERERIAEATAEKEAVTEQISEAPTTCSMCGASLPATIARGQSEISCEYCGTVIRL